MSGFVRPTVPQEINLTKEQYKSEKLTLETLVVNVLMQWFAE